METESTVSNVASTRIPGRPVNRSMLLTSDLGELLLTEISWSLGGEEAVPSEEQTNWLPMSLHGIPTFFSFEYSSHIYMNSHAARSKVF